MPLEIDEAIKIFVLISKEFHNICDHIKSLLIILYDFLQSNFKKEKIKTIWMQVFDVMPESDI